MLKKEQMMYDYVLKPESAPLRDLRAREMEILTTYKLLDPVKECVSNSNVARDGVDGG